MHYVHSIVCSYRGNEREREREREGGGGERYLQTENTDKEKDLRQSPDYWGLKF